MESSADCTMLNTRKRKPGTWGLEDSRYMMGVWEKEKGTGESGRGRKAQGDIGRSHDYIL